jgi:regulator of protease activity HflC (stomatin/prohibitin superfamily)
MEGLLTFGGILVAIIVLIVIKGVVIVPESYVYVREHLGSFDKILTPGLSFCMPFFKSIRKKVPTCEMTYDVPPQKVITKDNVQITADSFVFFNVFDAQKFTYGVQNPAQALSTLSQSTLRDFIGKMTLDECLSSRDTISKQMTRELDIATDKWGIKVTRVEIKTFEPPRNIMESMERQMKAEREKREQLILAEAAKQTAILDAEKNKKVACLNAEAARDAAELNAEATRIALVKKAEAEKEASLLRAEAAKSVKLKNAEAEAEAIRIVDHARAEGIKAVNASNPTEQVLRLKAFDAFAQAANGQATKIIVPSDMQGVIGLATALKESVNK